jgi:hypothetical protein
MSVYPRNQRISNKTNRCTYYPGCCCIQAEGRLGLTTQFLLDRLGSPVPYLQSLIIALAFWTGRRAARTIALKRAPHLSNLTFRLLAKGTSSRLRDPSPILIFAVLVTGRRNTGAGVNRRRIKKGRDAFHIPWLGRLLCCAI